MRLLLASLLLLTSLTSHALDLGDLTNRDAVAGLKAALNKGAASAVGTLGRTDGFLGNARVKIPLPDSLQRVEGTLRRFGMGQYADDLVVAMNRAAEAAVPEASALLISAVRDMSIQDAKGILSGGDTSATEYFRGKTAKPLAARFLPIVKKATEKVGLVQKYDEFAGKANRLGLLDDNQTNLENYVTQKALDGLFLMIADEEKEIRAHPVEQGSRLLSKVFGAVLND
ncbi:MAG TPA: DUF4197 domain-containing protein [Gallionellaceae bacterium]|nr:DUF4197 domain-containing protein [Gallionellaceae bacterium]